MTDAEILALSITELEHAIAKQIFELTIYHDLNGQPYARRFGLREELPRYARDIKAAKRAMDVIVRGRPGLGAHIHYGLSPEGFRYAAGVIGVIFPGAREVNVRAEAVTEEEARARAALMAHWRIKG